MTSTLDSLCDATLELEARAGDTAGEDLTLFVEETLEEVGILVVDILDTALLERQYFFFLLSTVRGVR